MKPPEGLSVKNTFEFVKTVKDTYIGHNEILASFDVESLYPSLPVEVWLAEQDLSDEERSMYHEMASVCVSQNYFRFDSEFYQQTLGTAMGNAL
jgi:hypothetical protein